MSGSKVHRSTRPQLNSSDPDYLPVTALLYTHDPVAVESRQRTFCPRLRLLSEPIHCDLVTRPVQVYD
jgi:hypothetical protein